MAAVAGGVALRGERRHKETSPKGSRSPFERDSDRVLYSSSFQRLGNVTQVTPSARGPLGHNRLTHSLKVAQLGRRIAERILSEKPKVSVLRACGGLNPDVVETAGRAHDLGHPPFGHIAEYKLNQLATGHDLLGGFEGNAQSFRVLTKLALRSEDYEGLNLSRATLNAVLKYPWKRDLDDSSPHHRKWGFYESESDDFDWAREGSGVPTERRTLEAEIMDLADELAYSVYDLDDFYRAGAIPMHLLFSGGKNRLSSEAKGFFEWLERSPKYALDPAKLKELKRRFKAMSVFFKLEPYRGSMRQRATQRYITSALINRFVKAAGIASDPANSDSYLEFPSEMSDEIFILKMIVWRYIIENLDLRSRQVGHERIIETLFDTFLSELKAGRHDIFPVLQRGIFAALDDGTGAQVRAVIDYIAGMTELHALEHYAMLTGTSREQSFRMFL